MNRFGFLRCAAVSISGSLLDCEQNVNLILEAAKIAEENLVDLVVFQELAITGATCGHMFFNADLLAKAKKALRDLAFRSKSLNPVLLVGFPCVVNDGVLSACAIIKAGRILAIAPLDSSLIPRERSFFHTNFNLQVDLGVGYEIPFTTNPITLNYPNFSASFKLISMHNKAFSDEVSFSAHGSADILVCPSAVYSYTATNFSRALSEYSSQKCASLVFANAGASESTGENVFLGECGIYELGAKLVSANIFENGGTFDFKKPVFVYSDIDVQRIQHHKHLSKTASPYGRRDNSPTIALTLEPKETSSLQYPLNPSPYIPDFSSPNCEISEEVFFTRILNYSAFGLARRLKAIHTDTVLLGISGGVDSTFALLVSVWAELMQGKPASSVHAITMPCFATTQRTKSNALTLAQNLGCTTETIDISATVRSHFSDIGHDENVHNTTFENAQARERTQVLLDRANTLGGIVVSASDLSEIALGWSTFAGDHISQYNVAGSLPKTVLRKFLSFFANRPELFGSLDAEIFTKTIKDILDTPVSPELVPSNQANTISQKTEDILGSYELHDFIIWHFVKNGFCKEKILFLAKNCFGAKYGEPEIQRCVELFFKRFFANQFKRSCSPEGAAVLPISLSPRGSWAMSSDIPSSFLASL